jgi:hypothetical protein
MTDPELVVSVLRCSEHLLMENTGMDQSVNLLSMTVNIHQFLYVYAPDFIQANSERGDDHK